MTVEEGHVLNIDGTKDKYKAKSNMSSAVSRGLTSDVEEGAGPHADRVSVLSGKFIRLQVFSLWAYLENVVAMVCKDKNSIGRQKNSKNAFELYQVTGL